MQKNLKDIHVYLDVSIPEHEILYSKLKSLKLKYRISYTSALIMLFNNAEKRDDIKTKNNENKFFNDELIQNEEKRLTQNIPYKKNKSDADEEFLKKLASNFMD